MPRCNCESRYLRGLSAPLQTRYLSCAQRRKTVPAMRTEAQDRKFLTTYSTSQNRLRVHLRVPIIYRVVARCCVGDCAFAVYAFSRRR